MSDHVLELMVADLARKIVIHVHEELVPRARLRVLDDLTHSLIQYNCHLLRLLLGCYPRGCGRAIRCLEQMAVQALIPLLADYCGLGCVHLSISIPSTHIRLGFPQTGSVLLARAEQALLLVAPAGAQVLLHGSNFLALCCPLLVYSVLPMLVGVVNVSTSSHEVPELPRRDEARLVLIQSAPNRLNLLICDLRWAHLQLVSDHVLPLVEADFS
mmetsp:Transcript_41625/g.77553  ORF Transcript_41625/g.77553 Transcript_41625/m.77553 type:complete len:214 (+) Transcript_41625:395-1036(+)